MTTYAKLEDDFPEHRKVVGLSDGAFRLYVSALCYSSRNLTDGKISRPLLKRFGGTTRAAGELIDANLWHSDPVGWEIHDYLKHQRSREAVLKQRADAVERALQSKRNRAAVAAQPERNPSRQSTELELELDKSSSSSARGSVEWFKAVTNREPPNAAFREQLLNVDRAHPPDCRAAVFDTASAKDDPWPYAKRIFDSCLLEGHEPRERSNGKHIRASAGRPTSRAVGSGAGVGGSGVDPAFDKYVDD